MRIGLKRDEFLLSLQIKVASNSPTITGPFSPFILRYCYSSSGMVWRCFGGEVLLRSFLLCFPPTFNTCCQKIEDVSSNDPLFQE